MTLEAPSMPESSQEEEIELNDFVIWESQGVKQFKDPKRVIRIEEYQDEKYVYLEGSKTAIPARELKVIFKTE